MPSSTFVLQWSHCSAQAVPVTLIGRKRLAFSGTHSELCQRLSPGA